MNADNWSVWGEIEFINNGSETRRNVMSADNWAVCPKCLKAAELEKFNKEETAREAYGVESPEEYARLYKEAYMEIDRSKLQTLREDYELSIDSDGLFYAYYSALCNVCQFKFDFKYKNITT